MRVTIRSMMVAVAVVACLLSLRTPAVQIVLFLSTILAALIFGPVCVAPPGCRVEVAYWALALHPLLLLGWLSALRPPGHRPPLYPHYQNALLEVPWFLAWLSRFYMPVLGALGGLVAASWFPHRSVPKPLAALPVAWLVTIAVLAWDPFELWVWAWD